MDEHHIYIKLKSEKATNWFLDLATADKILLPFAKISRSKISCSFEGFDYSIRASKGVFEISDKRPGFRINPENGQIILNLSH